jgi:hypothetical protein
MNYLDADVVDYLGLKDFQVSVNQIEGKDTMVMVTVRRLDTTTDEGWDEPLKVLLYNNLGWIHYIFVGAHPSSLYRVEVLLPAGVEFISDLTSPRKTSSSDLRGYLLKDLEDLPSYRPLSTHPIQSVSRETFNQLFRTDVVCLPSTIFAVGITQNQVYQYHDSYGLHPWTYEIGMSIDYMVAVALRRNDPQLHFYFLICGHDGYMEGYYPSVRNIPERKPTDAYLNHDVVQTNHPHTFPVLHKYLYVLGQAVHPDIPYCIAVPDRYYLCSPNNRYNRYRSIHKGLPFHAKKDMVVYAGSQAGSKQNFVTRTDILIPQRNYFKSDAVPKDNIYAPHSIDRQDMIGYKYILDIDGNSSTWDATAWKLNSGSVLFKTQSNWVQWFYPEFHPWTHYVPIADDFSNIQDQFRWCQSHPNECLHMIRRCKQLFQSVYRNTNVMQYVNRVIDQLIRSQTEPG